jgi:hypothetical protein
MALIRTALLVLALTAVGTISLPDSAEAKGFFVINTGSDIFETGPLPSPWDRRSQLRGWQAGYKCKIFGVFWAYFHKWGCEPVAFNEDTYDDSPELVSSITATYTESDIRMGAWAKHGRWLFAGLLVLGVVGAGRND